MPREPVNKVHPDTLNPSILFRQEHIDTLERNLRDGFLFRARSGLLDNDPYEFREVSGVRSFSLQGRRYTSAQVKNFANNLKLQRGDARQTELKKPLGELLAPRLGGHSNSSASSPFVSTSKTRRYATRNGWAGVVVRMEVGDKINAFRNPKVSGLEDEHLVLGSIKLQDVKSASVIGYKTIGDNFRRMDQDINLVGEKFVVSGDGITSEMTRLRGAWAEGLVKDAEIKEKARLKAEAELAEKARVAEELAKAKRASSLAMQNRSRAATRVIRGQPKSNSLVKTGVENPAESEIAIKPAFNKISEVRAQKATGLAGLEPGLLETRLKLPEINRSALAADKAMLGAGASTGLQSVFNPSLAKAGNASVRPSIKMATSNATGMRQTAVKAFAAFE